MPISSAPTAKDGRCDAGAAPEKSSRRTLLSSGRPSSFSTITNTNPGAIFDRSWADQTSRSYSHATSLVILFRRCPGRGGIRRESVGRRQRSAGKGFQSLFNGKDLTGWKVPEGDNGHWKIVNGVIDCDARSEAKDRDKSLWSEKSYGDFILLVDWRFKTEPGFKNHVPIILPDGNTKKDDQGKEVKVEIEDVDSGIYPARLSQKPGEHLDVADRLRRGLRLPDGQEDAARGAGRASRRRRRLTGRAANGTPSRSP